MKDSKGRKVMETERRGPVAPKDPVLKRPYFYIMHEKAIFASPQPDGRGIQFIYEDGSRLLDASKIAGNVTDEETLECLKTAEGFRKLVHSIGVAVTEGSSEKVNFVFQMYPKGPGEPSTSIEAQFEADGMERVIPLEEFPAMDTDRCPGQIRFEFAHPGVQASADVRFYLNDGFTAPPQTQETAVEFDSEGYREMIRRSVMQEGNLTALAEAVEKGQRGEEVTLAFIGGSITQGAGAIPIHENSYAKLYANEFEKRYAKGGVRFLKAGVGGTPSELGMIRFERDILRDGDAKPDVIVIEFAVNDEGDETKGVCFESLVRKALALPWHPAVVLLFAVFSFDWNLQDRLGCVGECYDLPMVSVLNAVTPQFPLLPGEGRIVSKNQFFYDIFHPSNVGHRIMSDCLLEMTEKAAKLAAERNAEMKTAGKKEIEKILERKPVIGADFEKAILLDRKELSEHPERFGVESLEEGSFDGEDRALQAVEMDSEIVPVPEFPYNWHYDGSAERPGIFRVKLPFRRALLVFKDSGDPAFGRAEVFVDGEKKLLADPLLAGWNHCNAAIIWNGESEETHTVEIRMAKGQEEKKFTILGFGIVK